MADCVSSSGPPQHNGLSYNITNKRGWNDPPSSVFSPSNSGDRKRIHPRKRVAHNLNSGPGFYNPPKPVVGMNGAFHSTATSNGFSQNFQSMSLTPNQHALPHANSNPDIPNMMNASPMMHHAMSVPNKLYAQVQGDKISQGLQSGMRTPPNRICDTPPLVVNGSCTPPNNMTPGRKFSAPSVSNSVIDSGIFNQLSTPTMLQSSHLNRSTLTEPTVPVTYTPPTNAPSYADSGLQPNLNYMQQNGSSTQNFKLQSHSLLPPMTNQLSSTPSQPQSLPPMPATSFVQQNDLYSRSNSTPGIPQRISPTSAFMSPPPTNGFYAGKALSNTNSPKNCSPSSSGHNSPVPGDRNLIENDSQLLNSTVQRLNDCLEKCSCHLASRVNDDIIKRINTFQQSWNASKLSNQVKLKMGQLSEALNNREFVQADNIHRSLILENSSEVMPWMVGIKKLISSYQQAVEGNR